MCINKTYSVLNGNVVANEYYSIRYVMDNDAPRFVLCDFFKSLGYADPYRTAHIYCKKLNLGKVVTKRNQLVTYVTKEEAEEVMQHMYLRTKDFDKFWESEVIPTTDYKYAELRKNNRKLLDVNAQLEKMAEILKRENTDLNDKIIQFQEEREKIIEMLANMA